MSVKEKPIIFSAESIRAILSGAKTQTRRVIKPQPSPAVSITKDARGRFVVCNRHEYIDILTSPYKRGMILWVRESWQYVGTDSGCCDLCYSEAIRNPDNHNLANIWYRADRQDEKLSWRSSIFMPKWASRIKLQITDLRLERLQQITQEDARAEGVRAFTKDGSVNKYWICDPAEGDFTCNWDTLPADPREAFHFAWDSLNEKRGYGWDSNPFVWVIEFRRIEG